MAAHQAPLSLGFSRQEYWSGLPLPSPVSVPIKHQTWLSKSEDLKVTGWMSELDAGSPPITNCSAKESKSSHWNSSRDGGLILSEPVPNGQVLTQHVSSLTYTTCPATTAKSLQLCPTVCNPIDSSPPGSPVPGILQARTLEWVAISFSNAWKWEVKVKSLSCVRLLVTPWTAAYQAPPPLVLHPPIWVPWHMRSFFHKSALALETYNSSVLSSLIKMTKIFRHLSDKWQVPWVLSSGTL